MSAEFNKPDAESHAEIFDEDPPKLEDFEQRLLHAMPSIFGSIGLLSGYFESQASPRAAFRDLEKFRASSIEQGIGMLRSSDYRKLALEMLGTRYVRTEQLPEREPTEPLPDYILRAITPSDREAFEADLQPIQESLSNLYADDADAVAAITKECDLLRWRFFGQANDPLPEALHIRDNDKQQVLLAQNEFAQELSPVAGKYEAKQMKLLQNNVDELHKIIADDIRETPLFMYLASFAAPAAKPTMQEMPLDQNTRARRIAEITHHLTRHYGIDAAQLQRPLSEADINAHRQYRHALAALDMEVEPRAIYEKVDPESDPYDALLQVIKERLAAMVSEESGVTFSADDVVFKSHYSVNVGSESIYLEDYLMRIQQSFYDPYEMPQFKSNAPLTLMVIEALKPNRLPYDKKLEYVVQGRANRRLDRLFTKGEWAAPVCLEEQLWIRRPLLPTYCAEPLPYKRPDKSQRPLQTHEIAKQLRQTVGEVLYDDRTDSNERLIASVRAAERPDQPTSNAEIVIALFDYDETQEPYIPGFTISSRTSSAGYTIFEFSKDADDPYESCAVMLSGRNVAIAGDAYARAGYHDIAKAIRNLPEMTVSDLVSIIENRLVYNTAPQSDRSVELQGDTFAVQCVGADEILRIGLQAAFPNSSRGINGNLLASPNKTSKINGIAHRQTVFIHEGKRYILDATPAATESIAKASQYNQANESEQSKPEAIAVADHTKEAIAKGGHSAKLPLAESVHLSQQQEASKVIAQASVVAENIRRDFEASVRMRLNIAQNPSFAANEDFYAYVLRTAKVADEPLRQAFNLVLDGTREQPSSLASKNARQAIQATASFVEALKTLPVSERKPYGAVVDDAALYTVVATLRQLAAFYNRLDWAFATLEAKD